MNDLTKGEKRGTEGKFDKEGREELRENCPQMQEHLPLESRGRGVCVRQVGDTSKAAEGRAEGRDKWRA
jgi:hypothetical protein